MKLPDETLPVNSKGYTLSDMPSVHLPVLDTTARIQRLPFESARSNPSGSPSRLASTLVTRKPTGASHAAPQITAPSAPKCRDQKGSVPKQSSGVSTSIRDGGGGWGGGPSGLRARKRAFTQPVTPAYWTRCQTAAPTVVGSPTPST